MRAKPASGSSRSSKPRYGAPAVQRAVVLLRLLAEEPAGSTLAHLCRRSGISKNSVFRILNTLVNEGILERDEESQKFCIGGELLGIAFRGTGVDQLAEIAMEPMRQLRNQTGETVLLGKLLRGHGVVLEQIPGTHPVKVHIEPGTPFLLHCSAPGKSILAALPEVERRALIKSISYPKLTPKTITNPKSFEKHLRGVAENGFAVDLGEETPDIRCVSAAILDYRNRPVAAVWITGPASRFESAQLKKFAREVMETAARISKRIGSAAQNNA